MVTVINAYLKAIKDSLHRTHNKKKTEKKNLKIKIRIETIKAAASDNIDKVQDWGGL